MVDESSFKSKRSRSHCLQAAEPMLPWRRGRSQHWYLHLHLQATHWEPLLPVQMHWQRWISAGTAIKKSAQAAELLCIENSEENVPVRKVGTPHTFRRNAWHLWLTRAALQLTTDLKGLSKVSTADKHTLNINKAINKIEQATAVDSFK